MGSTEEVLDHYFSPLQGVQCCLRHSLGRGFAAGVSSGHDHHRLQQRRLQVHIVPPQLSYAGLHSLKDQAEDWGECLSLQLLKCRHDAKCLKY